MSSQAAQTFTLTQWQAWDPARPQIWKSCAPAGIVISITTSGDLVSGIHQGGAGSTSVAIGRPVTRVPADDVPDAHRGSRRPAEVHPRSRREAVVQDPAQPMGSRKARNNTFLRLPAYAASAFSSQGPSIPNRSCDRTTGVVLRGTESLLTHRWRGQSGANSSLKARSDEFLESIKRGPDSRSINIYTVLMFSPGDEFLKTARLVSKYWTFYSNFLIDN